MKKTTRIFLAMAACLLITAFAVGCEASTPDAEVGMAANVNAALCQPAYVATYNDAAFVADDQVAISGEGLYNDEGSTIDSEMENTEYSEGDISTDQGQNSGGQLDEDGHVGDFEKEGTGARSDFEEIYNTVMEHISEILSLAAFIGSLICAIIYKSGLMPLMENGLKGLKNAAIKIKEATDKAELDSKESMSGITSRMESMEDTVADMSEAFLALAGAMDGYKSQMEHQRRIDTVLEGELDMLYDIFMTSSLPEYEKARVGERMTKLKEALNSGEGKK